MWGRGEEVNLLLHIPSSCASYSGNFLRVLWPRRALEPGTEENNFFENTIKLDLLTTATHLEVHPRPEEIVEETLVVVLDCLVSAGMTAPAKNKLKNGLRCDRISLWALHIVSSPYLSAAAAHLEPIPSLDLEEINKETLVIVLNPLMSWDGC